jgi:List-Bact-rpt repeat protein
MKRGMLGWLLAAMVLVCAASPARATTVDSVSVTVTGSGVVTSNPGGIYCPGTCSATFAAGTAVTLVGNPVNGSFFEGWVGACYGTGLCQVTANGSVSASAFFTAPIYTVAVSVSGNGTVTSSPAGINCPGTCGASFPEGTNLILTESSPGGTTFTGWSPACGSGATCTLNVNRPISETANFVSGQYALSVGLGGAAGTVTSSPAGISCPGVCSANFPANTVVTLTETPAANNIFLGWLYSCTGVSTTCTLTMNATQSTQLVYAGGSPLTVTVTGNGTVTSSQAGINCPTQCSASYIPGTSILLTAAPAAGQTFFAWGGACSGNGACNVTINNAASVSAQFIPASGITPAAGFWWNPNQPGSGFVIETQGAQMYMAAFLYSQAGEASWLASNGPMPSQGMYTGALGNYANGQTLTGAYRSPVAATTVPGGLSLTFSDATHATLSTAGRTLPIQRFDFGAGGSGATQPAGNPQTGWWWNPAEGGRGFGIEIQGTTIYLAGYMYDSAGNPTWYLASGSMASSTLFTGVWQQFAGGNPQIGVYQPVQVGNANAGSVTLQFTDNSNATLTLPDGRQIPLTRFIFGDEAAQ